MEKTQIAGSQEGSLARVREVRPESVLRIFGPTSAPLSHAGTRYPDLPHSSARAPGAIFGVDHSNRLICQNPPAGYQRTGTLSLGRRHDHPIALETRPFDGEHGGHSRIRVARNDQGRFRESEGGIE